MVTDALVQYERDPATGNLTEVSDLHGGNFNTISFQRLLSDFLSKAYGSNTVIVGVQVTKNGLAVKLDDRQRVAQGR